MPYSEIDSDPENGFSGRNVLIPKQDTTMKAQVRPLNCGRGNITTTSCGNIEKRGGRGVQSLSRGPRASGRGSRTRWGTIYCNVPLNKQVDNSNANTPSLPAISDDE